MARDNAPVGNTCPLIDDVVAIIQNIDSYDINIEEELKDMKSEISSAVKIMEQIRSANSELRDWGNELYSDKTDLENELHRKQDEIDDLESNLSDCKSEIKDLEEELYELKND